MFFPEEMSQVNLIVPARDLLAVTRELADQGVFHQLDSRSLTQEMVAEPAQADSWPETAAAYSNLERRILGIMQVMELEAGLPQPARDVSLVEIETVSPFVEQVDQAVKEVREARSEEQKRLEVLEGILHQIEPIADLDLDLSTIRKPGYIYSLLGVIPTANIDRLHTSLEHIPFVLETLREDGERAVIWMAGLKQDAEVLDRAARSAYLNPLSIPEEYQGTPAVIIEALRKDIVGIHDAVAEREKAIARLRKEHQKQIQLTLWQVRRSRIMAEAITRFGQLSYTYFISGWVPSSRVKGLTKGLNGVSKDLLIETSPFKRGRSQEEVPVVLHNPRLFRSFQSLVTTYGLPLYDEIDPTILLAITFPFLLGAMFGDAGQGLILALFGVVLSSKAIKALRGMSAFGGILTFCGLSATLFGFLYGNLFGFETVLHPLLIRPSSNTFNTLLLAIGAGVVLISLGFITAIINAAAKRDWGRLLFDPHCAAGLTLYWSLIALALEAIAKKFLVPTSVLGILAALAGVAIIFSEILKHLVNGHRPLIEEDLVTYSIGSFFELFEALISFLSNTISYVRIGAFAAAHALLSSAIFILGALISPAHGVGYWIVVVAGNLFIIGFEGMIVGIQSMRLEYYEFFSKFFSSGGLRYEPLSLQPGVEE